MCNIPNGSKFLMFNIPDGSKFLMVQKPDKTCRVVRERAGQGTASLVVIGQRLRGGRRGSVSRPIG